MEISLYDFIRFALTLVRFSAFLVVIPLFSMRSIPAQAKIGFAALLALLVMPPISQEWNLESLGVLVILSIHEVAVGLLLGLIVILVFSVIHFAGHFVDVPLGFGMASVFDPALGTQVPVFSQFYYVLGSLIFLGVDGHLWTLRALAQSYESIPFGGIIQMDLTFDLILSLTKNLFSIGLKMALPVVGTILLTDIALGIVIRAVPQINVFVIGFPIKIVVGMIIVILGLPAYVTLATQLFSLDGLLFRYLYGVLQAGGS
ncbi:MAG: flagellar type III secretion system protein FliR [Firmicutes bacterium]|nr:flagellar type III secretion system protein FliR [Bacillota bacterium]